MNKISYIFCFVIILIGVFISVNFDINIHVQALIYDGHWGDIREVPRTELSPLLPNGLKNQMLAEYGIFYKNQLVGALDTTANYISIRQFSEKGSSDHIFTYGVINVIGMLAAFLGLIRLLVGILITYRAKKAKAHRMPTPVNP